MPGTLHRAMLMTLRTLSDSDSGPLATMNPIQRIGEMAMSRRRMISAMPDFATRQFRHIAVRLRA